ncbi:MAG: DNA repair protein RecO [Candidatus Hatepunaea meridiana]|nr:DNA repair protein RecO [Candidatus Hatepunaea meridiana]
MGNNGPVKDEALVIRSIRHGETSRIVTLFTGNYGKIAVIAKGARRSKSGGAGGSLETANLIEAMIYIKATRSVQTLGQVSVINTYNHIRQDLVLSGYSTAMLELINLAFIDAEPNREAFDSAVSFLDQLEHKDGNYRLVLWKFQLTLLKAIGFALDPYACSVCGNAKANISIRNRFQLETGAVCCTNCQPQGSSNVSISGESVRILRQLTDCEDRTLSRLKPSRNALREISDLLERYLRHHYPNINKMPAMRMLDRFENL